MYNKENTKDLFLNPDTPMEIWAEVNKKLWRLIYANEELTKALEGQHISHIVLSITNMVSIKYNKDNDTCWVLNENKVYQYENEHWFVLYEFPDISSVEDDIEWLKKNKDIITDFRSYLDNDKLLHLEIETDLKTHTTEVDLSSLGGSNILPNACPIDAIVISSLNDITNATDLGGSYCLQRDIILDETVHGIIDGFYGDINLNGYTLSSIGNVPFINFKGKIHNGTVLNKIITNIISDDEGVQVPVFQNLSLPSQLFGTCETQVIFYGIIASSLIGKINAIKAEFKNCKIKSDVITGSVNELHFIQCHIDTGKVTTNQYTFTNLYVTDCKISVSHEELSGTMKENEGVGILASIPVSSTATFTNIIIIGKFVNVDLDSGAANYTTVKIFPHVGNVEGILNLNNYIFMMNNIEISQANSNNLKFISDTGVINNNLSLFLNSTDLVGVVDKYNTSPSYSRGKIDQYDTILKYSVSDITENNFKSLGFDPNIWDLSMIIDGYVPNLKNGANQQNKLPISSLPTMDSGGVKWKKRR